MTEGAVLYFIKISISDDTTTPVVDYMLHSTCSTAASTAMMGMTITVADESTTTAVTDATWESTALTDEASLDLTCTTTESTSVMGATVE